MNKIDISVLKEALKINNAPKSKVGTSTCTPSQVVLVLVSNCIATDDDMMMVAATTSSIAAMYTIITLTNSLDHPVVLLYSYYVK